MKKKIGLRKSDKYEQAYTKCIQMIQETQELGVETFA